MLDIKKTKINIDKKIAPTKSVEPIKEGVFFKNLSQIAYTYVALALFFVSVVAYVGGMVGISVVAISERNYDFKTQQLHTESVNTYTTSADEDTLALSNLNLNHAHISHVYLFEEPTSAMSRK